MIARIWYGWTSRENAEKYEKLLREEVLLEIAKNGKGKMPAWHDKLSEDQIKGLVAYIRTMQKKS